MRIGVIIPARDAAPWIADAVGSVIRQTHPAWSLIVVDDGSADATPEVVGPFLADPRIALIRQDRAGVSAARNRGMAACAEADALLFLDADDWLAPDALARLDRALTAASRSVAASGPAAFVPEHASPGARARNTLRVASGDLLLRLLQRNHFANGGHVLVLADAARDGSRQDIAYGEDWEFFIRVALRGPFAAVPGPDPLLFVRRRRAGAYARLSINPASFDPCMEAIFANPALRARLGAARLAALRARTEAENQWVIGRALLAQEHRSKARVPLRRSLAAKPSFKRLALTAIAHLPAFPLGLGASLKP